MQTHQETALVTLFDGNPVTNTMILAEGTGVQHKNIIGLVRKYVDDLSEFGLVAFQTRPRLRGEHGGGDVEFANLNEPQSALIMTYMSNTPVIREFKMRLIAAFFELAAGRTLAIQNTSQNPVQTRVSVNTSDLVREANKGNRFAQRLLHHLTGMKVDDIAAEIEHKLVVEDFKQAELAANYLDLLINSDAGKYGITVGISESGNPYVQGLTTQFFNVFKILGKLHGLPMLSKSVNSFGVILSKEAAGLEFYGWRRSMGKKINGMRFFRFECIGGAA
jgi:phage regulator Rha-like protein